MPSAATQQYTMPELQLAAAATTYTALPPLLLKLLATAPRPWLSSQEATCSAVQQKAGVDIIAFLQHAPAYCYERGKAWAFKAQGFRGVFGSVGSRAYILR
jgi:hypothetical protein